MVCLQLNGQNPGACAEHSCTAHIKAAERGDLHRKAASEAMNQLFPSKSKAEDATRNTP
jgi:hypothetical protein